MGLIDIRDLSQFNVFCGFGGGDIHNAQFVHGDQRTTSSVSPPASLPFVSDRVSPGPVTLAIQTGPSGPSASRDSPDSTPSQSTGL